MKRVMTLAALIAISGVAHADQALLERAREAVRAELREPKSAHFRNEFEKKGKVCGEVTARDEHGAYRGYAQYVFTGKAAIIAPLPGSKDDPIIDAVRRSCAAVVAKGTSLDPHAK